MLRGILLFIFPNLWSLEAIFLTIEATTLKGKELKEINAIQKLELSQKKDIKNHILR